MSPYQRATQRSRLRVTVVLYFMGSRKALALSASSVAVARGHKLTLPCSSCRTRGSGQGKASAARPVIPLQPSLPSDSPATCTSCESAVKKRLARRLPMSDVAASDKLGPDWLAINIARGYEYQRKRPVLPAHGLGDVLPRLAGDRPRKYGQMYHTFPPERMRQVLASSLTFGDPFGSG